MYLGLLRVGLAEHFWCRYSDGPDSCSVIGVIPDRHRGSRAGHETFTVTHVTPTQK